MLGRATDIIAEELEDGNPAIAQWLIDRVRPPGRSDFVQLAGNKLGSIEGILGASERIVVAASRGEISLQQARLLQDVLGRHAELKSLEALSVLRTEVADIRRTARTTATIDNSLLPKWGRLGEERK
ncbi:MAG: hypothetical protein ABJX32_04610 [Tateyamaria sp.]|uniref:hypothetical protein n=1 Tax=Tateyamaria sp. TaxID=1929288 RepID=UPI0032A0F2BD